MTEPSRPYPGARTFLAFWIVLAVFGAYLLAANIQAAHVGGAVGSALATACGLGNAWLTRRDIRRARRAAGGEA